MQKKIFNGIEISVAKDYQEFSRFAADFVIQKVQVNPAMRLLVPTGTTPLGFYENLCAEQEKQPNLFDEAVFFNLDEYVMEQNGAFALMDESDPRSYRFYMKTHLFEKFPKAKSYFPSIENAMHEGVYDELIQQNGGIDLCVDAIGEDGHTFGFNLPGSSFQSLSRLVKMNEGTRNVNQKLTGLETPEYAVTTGLQTGMNSREVILLISGPRKAEILQKIIYGEITEEVPTTILRNHPNCHWVIDEEAASKL